MRINEVLCVSAELVPVEETLSQLSIQLQVSYRKVLKRRWSTWHLLLFPVFSRLSALLFWKFTFFCKEQRPSWVQKTSVSVELEWKALFFMNPDCNVLHVSQLQGGHEAAAEQISRDVSQLCSQLAALWRRFLEAAVFNPHILSYLAQEHHTLRVSPAFKYSSLRSRRPRPSAGILDVLGLQAALQDLRQSFHKTGSSFYSFGTEGNKSQTYEKDTNSFKESLGDCSLDVFQSVKRSSPLNCRKRNQIAC